jgi:polyphosphate kinase
MAGDGSYLRDPAADSADAFSAHTYFMTNPSLSGRGRSLRIDKPHPVAIVTRRD